MPNVATAFRVQRLTLGAGVLTAVTPLIEARAVRVANNTGADLQVHTSDTETEYTVVAAGFADTFTGTFTLFQRRGTTAAFWLKSTPGGSVVLTWTP